MLNKSHIDGNGNIVIQDSANSTITINLDNSEEIRKFLIDFQSQLSQLPNYILKELQRHNDLEKEIKVGANIYLTILAGIAEYGSNMVLWGITITNLSKEHRYFNQPYFKVSPEFDLGDGYKHDTFIMFNKENIQFPVRLEYGQVLNLTYEINQKQFELFEKNASEESFMTAFCGTTVGELYSSDNYNLEKFVKEYKAILR